jgi:hypothetical protein
VKRFWSSEREEAHRTKPSTAAAIGGEKPPQEVRPEVDSGVGVVSEVHADGVVLVEIKVGWPRGWGWLSAMRCSTVDF